MEFYVASICSSSPLPLSVPLSTLSLLFLKGKSIQFILILSQILLPPKHAELLVSGEGILLH